MKAEEIDEAMVEVEKRIEDLKKHGVFSHRLSCTYCGKLEWCFCSVADFTNTCYICYAKKEYEKLSSDEDWIRKTRAARIKFAIKNRKREAD